jgi:hypothetical protein
MSSFYQLGDAHYTGVDEAARGDAGFRVQDYALRRQAGYTEADAPGADDSLAADYAAGLRDTRLRAAGEHLHRSPRTDAVALLAARFLSRRNAEYLATELGKAGVPAATVQKMLPAWTKAFAARIRHEVFRENGSASVDAQLVTANREFVADRAALMRSHPHAFGLADDPARYETGEWRSEHWAANRALSGGSGAWPRAGADRGSELYAAMQERSDRRNSAARLRPQQHTEVDFEAEHAGASPRVGAGFAAAMRTGRERSAAAARAGRSGRARDRGFQLKPE